MKYPKIRSIYKREDGKFTKEFSLPEFAYLQNNNWLITEKINGTNIRVIYEEGKVSFKGRTDNAQIPQPLLDVLDQIFVDNMFENMILFMEGVGPKIQSKDFKEYDIILFDAFCNIWLEYESIKEIAYLLKINCAPIICTSSLHYAIGLCQNGFISNLGNFGAEGVVCRTNLRSRHGDRIITKIKCKDF